ncbi:MAG: dockerin type I repeat-containing protein [Isosphaeraceae bacterium]
MSRHSHCRKRPHLERLESRLVLSLPPSANTYGLTPAANTIGISLGTVGQPGAIDTTSVTIAPENITPNKHSTEFALFVQPASGSAILPRIVGVEQDGKRLPFQAGRPYSVREAGQPTDQAAAFFETGQSGPVSVLVAGRSHTTGSYTVETTLPGDVNGDGQVNLADEIAFANAYVTKPDEPDYNPAADYNQNGIINIYDAMALERNMPALTRPGPAWAAINLAPQDAAHYSGPQNSGGDTNKQFITIDGYTTPGSIVLVDSTLGRYKFNSQALATDASGFFTVPAENTEGDNTYSFEILDPFGHQYIRTYPVFWIPFAAPGSKLKSPPKEVGGRIGGKSHASGIGVVAGLPPD